MRFAFSPPANWELLWKKICAFRKVNKAPVDSIGCHMLHDSAASKEDQRYQTLLALMLSAQTRDQCTAQAMHSLLNYGCFATNINNTSEHQLAELIKPVCFYNNKARHIKKTTEIIVKQYKGVVPSSYEQLTSMPGLGPKMTHLFLQCADGKVEGIGVDVHVHRIAQRWNWVQKTVKTPDDTRQCLELWLPKKYWSRINWVLVGFGQTVCLPRNPRCHVCPGKDICPNAFVESKSLRDIEEVGESGNTQRRRNRTPTTTRTKKSRSESNKK